jgi:cytochrome c-type biogenesis protein CcmH/NrfG
VNQDRRRNSGKHRSILSADLELRTTRRLIELYGPEDPEAISRCRQALQHNPDFADGWYTLGIFRHQQKEYGEAISALTGCVRQEPVWAETWYALGVAHLAQGDGVHAKEIYRRLCKLVVTQARTFLRREMRR